MAEAKEVKKIKKSKNFIQVSGVLLETNLTIEEGVKAQAWSNKEGKMKDITCDVVKKKEFKNPSLLIECSPKNEDGEVVGTYQLGIDFNGIGFGVTSKQFDRETDKIVDNDNFKGIQTVLDKYNTRLMAETLTSKNKSVAEKKNKDPEYDVVAGVDYDVVEATKVFIKSASLSPNEYVDKELNFKSYLPTITTYNVTSSGVPENDICEGHATGIIRTIKEEVFNEEETGRLKVDFYMFDNKGETFPVEFTVEKDLADDFKDFYEAGVSCKVYFDVITRQVGAKKVASNGGFGRKEANTTSGFNVTEYSIFKGEEPFEEENENFVSKTEMKKAMESRTITIEQRIKKAKDNADKPKETKKGGLGSKASKLSEVKEDEDDSDSLPF